MHRYWDTIPAVIRRAGKADPPWRVTGLGTRNSGPGCSRAVGAGGKAQHVHRCALLRAGSLLACSDNDRLASVTERLLATFTNHHLAFDAGKYYWFDIAENIQLNRLLAQPTSISAKPTRFLPGHLKSSRRTASTMALPGQGPITADWAVTAMMASSCPNRKLNAFERNLRRLLPWLTTSSRVLLRSPPFALSMTRAGPW